ncbi:MAG: thiamine phosphate synthase, partial [Planctomycetaceae bacterium]|nr:thiamine phosphate synthase [Planctomycetaceae bacterium]
TAMHSDLLHPDLWTSGARRSLIRAAQVATLHQSAEVEPLHLLWALLMDEGRAGMALEEAGVTPAVMADQHVGLATTALEAIESIAATVAWGAVAETIVREARHVAFQSGAADEAGTDHLLAALAWSETDAAQLLATPQADIIAAMAPPASAVVPLPEISATELQLDLRERSVPNLAELYRILDAAANRAREGFRVVEDYARFGINDRHLSEQLKHARHELTAALEAFPQPALLSCRDTLGDVGTSIETRREYHRTDVFDVITAAFKRIQEALRSLEEYGKVVSGDVSRPIERLRYRVYTLEKAVLQTATNRERLADQRLYLLLTDAACPGGIIVVMRAAFEAGVRMFQVREKTWDDRALLEHCRRLRRWTREREALLIVNDRPDLAVLCDADGVHVGQEELTVADARRIVGPDRLVGVSTHTIEQARQAVLDGADYLGVGPTFPSQTKSFAAYPGLDFVRQVSAEIALPWFAIGGIQEANIADVVAAGATRVAVANAITASATPVEAAATMLQSLRGAESP